MKKLPLFIGIPLAVLLLIVAAVFIMRMRQTTVEPTAAVPTYQLPDTQGVKPNSGFSSGSSQQSRGSSGDLAKDLQSTADDGGAKDIQDLQTFANGL